MTHVVDFHLPLQGKEKIMERDTHVVVQATGLLASMGGVVLMQSMAEIIDPGGPMDPVTFKCPVGDLESIHALLEESLQEKGFDRDKSRLVIRYSIQESHLMESLDAEINRLP